MLELTANPDKIASGTIIEASLDKGRGYVSTVMVQEGTLKIGDYVVAGQFHGKVKAMQNERGGRVTKAGPSTPVLLLGIAGAPTAGDKFKVYESEQEAKEIANKRSTIMREQGIRATKHITLDEIGRRLALGNFKELKLIIKGDVDGSVEALSDSLLKLSTEEIQVSIVHRGVGQITENDVLLAAASDAVIIAFQVRPSPNARLLAERESIEIRNYSIIYTAIEEVKKAMEGMLDAKFEEKIVATVEVRETFKVSKVGTIAGCYVMDGKITRNNKIRVIRDGIVVHSGELEALKRFKDDVKDVTKGYECGIKIKNYNDVMQGDIIESYEQVEVKRKL
jgi:translation initiation factor IF-2